MDGAEKRRFSLTDMCLEQDGMDTNCPPSTNSSPNPPDFESPTIDTPSAERDIGAVLALRPMPKKRVELPQSMLKKLSKLPQSMLKKLSKLRSSADTLDKERVITTVENPSHDFPSNSGNSRLNLSRSAFEGNRSDRDDPITMHYQRAMNLPLDHPHLPDILSALGSIFNERFEKTGHLSDTSRAIEAFQKAISLTPDAHDFYHGRLTNLGNSFVNRFERTGDLSDIEEAITAHQTAIRFTPDGHPDLPTQLDNLGTAFTCRFEQTGDPSDIAQGIAAQERALVLVPADDAKTPVLLNNKGCSFRRRFERMGDISDLTEAVAAFRSAVEHTPVGHANLPSLLNNSGTALMLRFKRMGDLCDISEAISLQQRSIELIPDGHINLPIWLSFLGTCFMIRFGRTGNLSDLSRGIKIQQRVTRLTPDDHPQLAGRLDNLGCSLRCLFERTGELSDIDESIKTLQMAISLTPDGHAGLHDCLNNLANSFESRFRRTGEPSDLAEAVALLERAVDLIPGGHPDFPTLLNSLGVFLVCRFRLTGSLADIDRAIASSQRATGLVPNCHPEFGNLGSSLMTRFERTGVLSDLANAIGAFRTAIELPDGHAELPGQLSNLGNAFIRQFERTGDLSTAAEAIAAHQKAVNLTPGGHAGLTGRLANLGSSYMVRFRHKGDVSDLAVGISLHQRAVDRTPDGHVDLPTLLNNLANSLVRLFGVTGNLRDISRAIGMQRRAVDLTPENHPHYPDLLNGLGSSLTGQFSRTGELSVINEAVTVLKRSVTTIPNGHSNLPTLLSNLAESFMLRFSQTHDSSDITEAIAVQQKVVDLTLAGDANLTSRFSSLAAKLQQRALSAQNDDAMDASIENYKSAANCTSGPPSDRLRAGMSWSSLMYHHHPDSPETLNAFDTAIRSVSLIAGLEDTVQDRYAHLRSVSHFPSQAAAAACSLGRPDKALEWLEQSRCLVWAQLNNLRMPLDALREHHEDLAQRLSEVSRQLEASGSSRRAPAIEMPFLDKISANGETYAHLKLAKEWDELINTVRNTVPGFENFLRPTPSSTHLRHLPESGFIVIVNVHESRCDAIILRAGQDKPSFLALPEFSLEKAIKYRDGLSLALQKRGVRLRETVDSSEGIVDEEMGRGVCKYQKKGETGVVLNVLENLWNEVVKPVVAVLGLPLVDVASKTQPPRIWWCPTGPLTFLPLHASGAYGGAHPENIFDYAVSSYTPTITSITDRVKNSCPIDASISGLLLTSQPNAPGAPSIPGVTKEVTSLHTLATDHGVRSLKLEGGAVTVPEFLEHMDGYSSVHLACHGSQNASEPLQSRFLFHDGSLDLVTIIKKNLKHADLAFLSACQTSTGGENLTEEAVHLAAGMLAAGYRRVVATMWAIKDQHAPHVASDFYNYLTSHREEGSGSGFDGSLSAYALHHAIQQLRRQLDNSEESLLAWIPYVHFGL